MERRGRGDCFVFEKIINKEIESRRIFPGCGFRVIFPGQRGPAWRVMSDGEVVNFGSCFLGVSSG
jgi:hypothetical protein